MAFRCPVSMYAQPPCVNFGSSLLDGLVGVVIVVVYLSIVPAPPATTTRVVVHPPHRLFPLGGVVLPRNRDSLPPMLLFLARAGGSPPHIGASISANWHTKNNLLQLLRMTSCGTRRFY